MVKKVTTGFRQPHLFPFCVLSGERRTKSHQIVKRSFEKVANFKHTEKSLTQIARTEKKSDECLLPFSPVAFVFLFNNYKTWTIDIYNFACFI